MKVNLRSRTRRGLTLLELMIVLVILVGLMAVVGPRLLGTQKKADIRTAQAQIKNLESALKMYALDMKSYPLTEEGLDLLINAPEDEAMAKRWEGPYVEGGKLPKDPWGSDFEYEFEAADSKDSKSNGEELPRITSPGPDRQSGTSDDISNVSKEDEEGTSKSSSKRKG